jgi:hypothetical protein
MPLRFDHPDHSSDVGFGYPGLTPSSDEPPISGARNLSFGRLRYSYCTTLRAA